MLSSFPAAILVGALLGFLSGLGVGGGSLLVVWLTAVLAMEPRMAQCVILLFFLHRNIHAFPNFPQSAADEILVLITIKHTLFHNKRFPSKKQ